MKKMLFGLLCLLLIGLGLLTGPASAQSQGGQIEAVKLIGAWVDAGAKETDPFTFKGKDGKEYQATFKDDILPLFTQPNVWAPNTAACATAGCHDAISEKSAHELNMGTYQGIMTGADSLSNPTNPAKLFEPGKWADSRLRARLRNNRMPPGMPFDITEANRDGPVVKSKTGGQLEAVKLIGAWVDAGAKETDPFTFKGKDGKEYQATFKDDILPLFTQPNVWAPNTAACATAGCHDAISEKSAHELNMGTYQGIMTGADSLSNPTNPAKLFEPGKWADSRLRARLRNNRMPPGMPFDITEANRDGPLVLVGAKGAAPAALPKTGGVSLVMIGAGLAGLIALAAGILLRRRYV